VLLKEKYEGKLQEQGLGLSGSEAGTNEALHRSIAELQSEAAGLKEQLQTQNKILSV